MRTDSHFSPIQRLGAGAALATAALCTVLSVSAAALPAVNPPDPSTTGSAAIARVTSDGATITGMGAAAASAARDDATTIVSMGAAAASAARDAAMADAMSAAAQAELVSQRAEAAAQQAQAAAEQAELAAAETAAQADAAAAKAEAAAGDAESVAIRTAHAALQAALIPWTAYAPNMAVATPTTVSDVQNLVDRLVGVGMDIPASSYAACASGTSMASDAAAMAACYSALSHLASEDSYNGLVARVLDALAAEAPPAVQPAVQGAPATVATLKAKATGAAVDAATRVPAPSVPTTVPTTPSIPATPDLTPPAPVNGLFSTVNAALAPVTSILAPRIAG